MAIWHDNITPMLSPAVRRLGFEGRFHIRSIVDALEAAALSGDHILLSGATGTGKELAARALCSLICKGDNRIPFVAHNAADFGTEDEVLSTLFGTAKGAYTGVSERTGLVETNHARRRSVH